MTLQLHRLEGFYHVARVGGYAKAARDFPYPISQPAVHQQVKKLEGELGKPLFERVGRDRLILTPAGKALWEFIAPFFEQFPAVVRSIQADETSGELRVWAETLLIRHLLPPWVGRVNRASPDLALDLREVRSPGVDCLLRGETDVLIAHLAETPPEIASAVVAEVRPFLVLPADHALAKPSRVPWKKLGAESFIAYERDLRPFELQMRALAAHGVEPTRVMSVSTADAILAFVASGLGYSIVPSLAPEGPDVEGVVVRRMSKPARVFEVRAAWRAGPHENPLVRAFLAQAPAQKAGRGSG